MQPNQTTDYIHQQLSQGYSEAAIRQALVQSGWQPAQVDQAFAQYYALGGTPAMQPGAQPAGQARAASKSNKPFILALAVFACLLILVVVIAVVVAATHKKSPDQSTASPVTAGSNSYLQRQADLTSEKNDASALAAAIDEFIANNNGSVPQSIVPGSAANTWDVCAAACTTGYKSTATLNYFKNAPQAVQIKPFKSGLKAPDENTVYVVPAAKCQNDTTAVAADSTREFALLFASAEPSGLNQLCVGS